MSYVGNTWSKSFTVKVLFCIAFLITLAFPLHVLAKVKQSPTVPPVGLEWIKVKIPLKYSYHSTGDSRHKNIISNKSEIENLSEYPVEVNLSDFVSEDGKSAPNVTGIDNLFMDIGEKKINLVTDGKPNIFNNGDNLTKLYILGPSGGGSPHGNFKGSSKGKISFSGNTQDGINLKKVVFQDNRLNFIFKALDGDGNLPKDQTTIKVMNSKVSIGTGWKAEDSYVEGKDEYGNPLDFSKVTIGGDKVDTNKAGEYKVTYSYRNVTETAVVSVIPELTFMNQKWNIIKGPKQLGTGKYLIAGQQSLGSSLFASRKEYYNDDNDSLDGYQDSTLIKPIIDQWYDKNIKGTIYENYIEPVVLSNPTLGDMKKLGWTSNTSANSGSALLAINQPDAYPTKIDSEKGEKQAFVMSGSDISNGQGKYGDLSDNGLLYRDLLTSKGYQKFWLRTPGQHDNWAGIVRSDKTSLWDDYLSNPHEVMPSLIIHTGNPILHVKNSEVSPNSVWKMEDNFVGGTDEFGNTLATNKIVIGGDKVDTSKIGTYNVTYNYGGVTETASIKVKDETTIKVKNSVIDVGACWKAEDSYVEGKDEYGNSLDFSKVTIGGDKVDTNKAGEYKVTYSYRNVTETAVVTVTDKFPKPGSDGTIDFMNQKWDVIKGPDQMGGNNYLIVSRDSIGRSKWNDSYFQSNLDDSNGYQDSQVKKLIDKWYENSIKGTIYEKFVQPVIPFSPTLGDMKTNKYGAWSSSTSSGSYKGARAACAPDAFPTKVDATIGSKQAFLLSYSDLTTNDNLDLTANASKCVNSRGESGLIVRNPRDSNTIYQITRRSNYGLYTSNAYDVYPSIVISFS